ncbi:MbcA/ParS/Xre antitoxin family protein [Solidesulfovibrio sp.]|uniref:MbcA/ParS/Xre antitoxin family protein n=1 Tax=Solidesulfovibrio sp. TaxID=2910990 RepID=UPI00260346D7|nr:MbcA/ParS/Xre antitoxin family protein [Solidesulfovibrio sp.]
MPLYPKPEKGLPSSQGRRSWCVKRDAATGCFTAVEGIKATPPGIVSKTRRLLAQSHVIAASETHLKLQAGNYIIIEENPAGMDDILRISEIIHRATEVFGSQETARKWLSKPKAVFQEMSPLRYSQTEAGAAFVLDVLGRIEHGVFS